MEVIIIDGSYFVFHRYFALLSWWKYLNLNNKPENSTKDLDDLDDLSNNSIFIDKFIKTFKSKINELEKKLNINKDSRVLKIVAFDCPRKDIWRNSIFDKYKSTRNNNDNNIKNIFKLTYNKDLFINSGVHIKLYHPHLEADDCIAITTKYIHEKYPESNISIITSDMDYLQLANNKTHLIDLKFKDLTQKKKSTNDPNKDLFYKILIGDKSDNIPPIFPKCGIKTAEKYYNNNELFQKKLHECPDAKNQYIKNRELIDFNYIPNEYIDEFKNENLHF